MQHRNHTAKWALAVATLFVLISGSMVLGSNMGFKFNMPIVQQTGTPEQGQNHVALPYLVPYADRQCLCDQLGLPSGSKVEEFNAAFGDQSTYFCGTISCGAGAVADDFLHPGKAAFITTSAALGSGIVVGSHDPAFAIHLDCLVAGRTPPAGDNWISPPYHTTAAVAQDICDEIGSVTRVEKFGAAFGDVSTYFCGTGSNNFAVVPGDGLNVVLDNTATGVHCAAGGGPDSADWTPSHY